MCHTVTIEYLKTNQAYSNDNKASKAEKNRKSCGISMPRKILQEITTTKVFLKKIVANKSFQRK